jgi:Uma2 family endonuclease
MVAMINDSMLEERLIRERQENGSDRYDEVWEGVYMMSPIANNEHQYLALEIAGVLRELRQKGDRIYAGLNVSDRENWTFNFRVPDVAVYLKGNPAEDRKTFMLGGPDLAVEIVSKGDRTFEKIDFYASVKTKELLILNRQPWEFELYRHDGRSLVLAGKTSAGDGGFVSTETIPLNWQLLPGEDRPELHLSNSNSSWTI